MTFCARNCKMVVFQDKSGGGAATEEPSGAEKARGGASAGDETKAAGERTVDTTEEVSVQTSSSRIASDWRGPFSLHLFQRMRQNTPWFFDNKRSMIEQLLAAIIFAIEIIYI